MRNGLVVGLAVVAFALGAWSSPRLTATQVERFPIPLQAGQRVSTSQPSASICEIEQQSSGNGEWVKCRGTGEWRNLATGDGFFIHDSKR